MKMTEQERNVSGLNITTNDCFEPTKFKVGVAISFAHCQMIIIPKLINTSKYYNRQVENRSSFKHQEVENDDVDYSQVSSCAQNKQK